LQFVVEPYNALDYFGDAENLIRHARNVRGSIFGNRFAIEKLDGIGVIQIVTHIGFLHLFQIFQIEIIGFLTTKMGGGEVVGINKVNLENMGDCFEPREYQQLPIQLFVHEYGTVHCIDIFVNNIHIRFCILIHIQL
jgi:hypothetical protein